MPNYQRSSTKINYSDYNHFFNFTLHKMVFYEFRSQNILYKLPTQNMPISYLFLITK